MFDFSLGEVALVAVVGMVFIRPKDLPVVVRAVAKVMNYFKALSKEVKDAFNEVARDAGVDDLKQTLDTEMRLIKGDDGKFYEAYDVKHILGEAANNQAVKNDDQPAS